MSQEKKKRKGDLLYRIMVVILLFVIMFSLYKVIQIMNKYQAGTSHYNKVAEKVGASDSEKGWLKLNWKKMKKLNKDTVAWLRNPKEVINYPVAQGDDNEFYLHHLLNKKYDFKGTLFVDYRNQAPFHDFNTIIYGHHMKDGSMFHDLDEYKDQSYYKKHPVMQLYTADQKYELHIFAAMEISARSPLYDTDVATEEDQAAYLDAVYEATVLNTDVSVRPGDSIVMMSTCTTALDESRMVVYGKLVKH